MPYGLTAIPFFGGLFLAKWAQHKSALAELTVNFVLATIPIWLGGLILLAISTLPKTLPLFISLSYSTIQHGELFLGATSLVAPVLYEVGRDRADRDQFPSRLTFIILCALICIVCAAFFALFRDSPPAESAFTATVSIVIYCATLVLLYTSYVYKAFASADIASELSSGPRRIQDELDSKKDASNAQ